MNVTPKEGLSAFVGVLATLMRDCPEEWDDSKGWCDGILHQPTGIELTFFDWNVMMHGPESMTFGLVNSIRLRLARRPVKRSIARRREVARLKALTAKLLRLRENVVSIRDTTA